MDLCAAAAPNGTRTVVFLLPGKAGLKLVGKVRRFRHIPLKDKELSVGERGSQTRRATACENHPWPGSLLSALIPAEVP